MKRILPVACALLCALVPSQARKTQKFTHETVQLPAMERQIISVQTENTSLVLLVHENGALQTVHYGTRLPNPEEYLALDTSSEDYNGDKGATYPATGGRYVGEPALHVKYADGSHNTELYYTGHEVSEKDGVVTTTIRLRDYVTGLRVRLFYEAYEKQDVIASHAEILNPGEKTVELVQAASSSLYVDADEYLLTHFWGAWAADMQLEREVLGHDMKGSRIH